MAARVDGKGGFVLMDTLALGDFTRTSNNEVSNSISSDGQGIFIVTQREMCRVDFNPKTGRLGPGAGSTPSVTDCQDKKMVVITDGAMPMNVMWYDAETGVVAGQRKVQFAEDESGNLPTQSEQSVAVDGCKAFVVQNYMGMTTLDDDVFCTTIDHAYGREFPFEALSKGEGGREGGREEGRGRYDVVVHCGGCMIDRQKIRARMEECEEAGVAMTNYGLLLAYAAGPAAFLRAIKPFDVLVPPRLLKHALALEKKKMERTGGDANKGETQGGNEGAPSCMVSACHCIIMGQTLSTLGGVVGYKHEHRTGDDGVAKTFVTVLDTSVFKRKIKLQLAIVHEPQEEEDVATGAAAAGAAAVAAAVAAAATEDREAAPRLDLIQEAVDDESTQPPADDDRQEDHDLPPLAFVDEEDDNSSTTSSTKVPGQQQQQRQQQQH
eukprot:evm.model.NODE_8766_length_20533_cov_18.981249.2